MAFPGLTMITVSGQLAGLPDDADGMVEFAWPWLYGPDGQVVAAGHKIVRTDAEGEFTATVPATNQPTWSPTGWTLGVTVTRGPQVVHGTMAAPYDGGSIELGDVFNPDQATEPGQTYALSGHTHPGGGTGPILISDVTGLTAALAGKAALVHTHTQDQVTGLVADLAAIDGRVDALEAAPGGGTAATFARGYLNGTGTDVTVPVDAAWAAVSGVTWSIPAAAGDDIATDVHLLIDMTTGGTDYFDLAVMVAGAPVRCASSGTATPAAEGDPALYPSPNVRFRGSSTGMAFTAQAGDVSGGSVTFALIHKGGAGAAKVYRSDAFPLRWSARNDH